MAESLLSTVLPSNSIRPEWPRHEISTVFVENSNNKATMEDVYYNNNIIISAQSSEFGATNSFKLTKAYHFLRNAVLKISLGLTGTPPQFYNDYVGHSMIDNIKYQIDSTELLQQNGYALVDIMNENCENQEQKNKLLEMSGYKEIGMNATAGDIVNLYVPLILPCCGIDSGSFRSEKAFPLYLVPGHIELLIQMRNLADICATTGQVTIKGISLLVNYGKIGNFSQMAKMIRYPTRQYINTQRVLQKDGDNDGSKVLSISLTSFRRAELTNILLRWCPSQIPQGAGANFNFYDGSEISRLNVLFNGVQIWSNTGGPMSDPIWDVLSGEKPSYMGFKRQVLKINGNGAIGNAGLAINAVQYNVQSTTDGDFTKRQALMSSGAGGAISNDIIFYGQNSATQNSTVPFGVTDKYTAREQRYYNINLSEIRANMLNNNEYALGYDLSKQTLNLEFVLPKSINRATGDLASNGGYIYVTYIYNSIYQLEEDQSSVLAF